MTVTRFGLRLRNVGLLLPLGYSVFLAWQEWRFREFFVRPP
jgi:hypothetical protein